MPALASPPAHVQHGRTYDLAAICKEAADALAKSKRTQQSVADELGVSRGAIGRAVNEPGGQFLNLQRRIIALLTDYTIEGEPVYRAVRKGGGA